MEILESARTEKAAPLRANVKFDFFFFRGFDASSARDRWRVTPESLGTSAPGFGRLFHFDLDFFL